MSRHVVFGTGQIGRLLATRLTSLGHDVVGINRSGLGTIAGARIVGIDATDRFPMDLEGATSQVISVS